MVRTALVAAVLAMTGSYANEIVQAQATQATQPAQEMPRPTFRTSVDLVSVAAVVRDQRGKVVRDLRRDDFVVLEDGRERPIIEFAAAEDGPVSVALLVDVSGSMRLATNMSEGRQVIEHLLSWLNAERDEIALFTFDTALREESPFTTNYDTLRQAVSELKPFGATSLYDAIGQTAEALERRPARRRAIVVLTDGRDNRSGRSPSEVSAVASGIDVPVYVISILTAVEAANAAASRDVTPAEAIANTLYSLASWTGGTQFSVSTPAEASIAARTILAELRHQYLLAFESAAPSGWRPLSIRLRRRELSVRARSGFFANAARTLG